MSTIVSTTLQDRASGKNLPTASMISGAAKAWVLVNGISTPAGIYIAFNVSSIGDLGVGSYSLGITSLLANFNCITVSSPANIGAPLNHTPAAQQIATMTHAGTATDQSADVHICGDLA